MKIILASSSSSRADILKSAGFDVKIAPADIDESIIKDELKQRHATAEELTVTLALKKAEKISAEYKDAYVIGADQVLECSSLWFDKPLNINNARMQLKQLKGKTHRLVNGVVILKNGKSEFIYNNEVMMTMRDFSEDFLEKYLNDASEKILYSCGSYRLEGLGSQLFTGVDGDFFSVLGMPLLPMQEFFRKVGVLER